MKPREYSRKHIRIRPDTLVFGKVKIMQVDNKRVTSNSANVRILNFSVGGVRFASMLKLPISKRVVLELYMTIEGTDYRMEGFITNRCDAEIHEYEHGFCFQNPEKKLENTMLQIFRKLLIGQGLRIYLVRTDTDI